MASFSDYYQKALSDLRGQQSAPRQKPDWDSFFEDREQAPANGNPDFFKDPIGSAIDFLMRPLYGVNNVIMGKVNDFANAAVQAREGDPGALVGAGLKQLFDFEVGPRFVEGLTTSDKTKKRLGSDVIEEATDTIGQAADLDYVNREDNVDPIVKGPLGLGMDLALDPLNFVPIPVGTIARGARKITGRGRTAEQTERSAELAATREEIVLPGEKGAEEAVEQPVFQMAAPARTEGRVTPREAMNFPMPEPRSAPRPVVTPESASEALMKVVDDADSADVTPTPAKVEREMDTALNSAEIVDAPKAAQAVAKIEKQTKIPQSPEEIAAYLDTPEGQADLLKVTAHSSWETFDGKTFLADMKRMDAAIRRGKPLSASSRTMQRISSANNAIRRMKARQTNAPVPKAAKEAVKQSPRDEARSLWVAVADTKFAIETANGEVPVTRQMIEQALELERKGELPEGWEDNLRVIREEAELNRPYLKQEFEATAIKPVNEADLSTPSNASAARNNAENGESVTPEKVAAQKKIQGEAERLDGSPNAVSVSKVVEALTPNEIIASSGMAEDMRKLLDTVEMIVKAGGKPGRKPVQIKKGITESDIVRGGRTVSDYMAAYNHWVLYGLDDMADANGRVSLRLEMEDLSDLGISPGVYPKIELVPNPQTRTVDAKFAVQDVKEAFESLTNLDRHVEQEGIFSNSTVRMPYLTPEDDALLALSDRLFREEIELGGVYTPAVESVEVTNLLEAWQFMMREQADMVLDIMGRETFDWLKSQMNGNLARFTKRMEVLTRLLRNEYDLSNLEVLRDLSRLADEAPQFRALNKDLGLGLDLGKKGPKKPSDALAPASEVPTPEVPTAVEFVPDPTPTTPPSSASTADPAVVEEVVNTPSTVTPKPSTPQEITEIVNALDSTPSKDLPESRLTLIAEVGRVLKEVFDSIKAIPKTHPYTTKTGAKRTHEVIGEGLGNYDKKFGSADQYTIQAKSWRALEEYSKPKFREAGASTKSLSEMKSKNQSRWQASLWEDFMDLWDKAMNKLGVKQVLGYGEDLIPLSYFDIYKAMKPRFSTLSRTADAAEDARLLVFFNGSTRVNPTALMEATRLMLFGASDDEILQALRMTEKPGPKGSIAGEKMPNNWVDKNPKTVEKSGHVKGFHVILNQRLGHTEAYFKEMFPEAKLVKTGNKPGQETYWLMPTQDDLANATLRVLREAQDDLAKLAVNNGWRQAERGATEAYDMASDLLSRLDDLYANPTGLADFLREVDGIPESVAGRGTEIGAYQDSVDAATEVTRAAIGDDIVNEAENLVAVDRATSRGSKATEEAIDQSTRNRNRHAITVVDEQIDAERARMMLEANLSARLGSDDLDEVAEALDEAFEIYDLTPRTWSELPAQIAANLGSAWGRFKNFMGETFDYSWGHGRLYDIEHNATHISQRYLGHLHGHLTKIAKAHSTDEIVAAFEKVQNKIPPAGDELMEDLISAISRLWDPSEDGLFRNVFLNMEKNIDYVNDVIATKFEGSKSPVLQFDIDLAKARAKEEGLAPDQFVRFLGEQWRSLKVTDPLDFISRLSDAAVTIAERKAIVESFVHRAREWGAMSTTPRPGFVRVPHTSNRSAFSVFLPQQTASGKPIFYDKELIKELHRADILTDTSRSMGGWIDKYFMPVQNAWKIAMTIYRPGHHIRNLFGDASLTWVARGNRHFSSSSKKAFHVLAISEKYSDVDFSRALNNLSGQNTIPQGGDVIISGRLGGSDVKLTARDIADLLDRKGLKPTYSMNESLFDDAILQTRFSTAIHKISLQGTKFHTGAATVSQARDHWSRAQHFIQILEQELGKGGPFGGKRFKAKNLEDLFDQAASEVKKFHPDASMLTPRESKYFRVVIPFYSWFAKVLPGIGESFLRHPGRVTAFPKASYELAVSMGVNPDTIYDPFPQDQLFPSFLTEKALGPQFQVDGAYYGINPGIAHLDVMNTLGPDPVRGILGMTTPLIRAPFEMIAQSSLGTGARINDQSDYLDETLPGVNYLSDVMGVSVTGTLGSVLSGKPGIDPQFQVARGNKGEFGSFDTANAFINWATGIGLQNMSRPNYINFAELEKKREGAEP